MAILGLGDLGYNPNNVANAIAKGNSVDLSPLSPETLLGIGATLGSLGADVEPIVEELNRRATGANCETTLLTERAKFLKQIYQLEPEHQHLLASGKWQISEHRMYVNKVVTGIKHLDAFDSGDRTEVHITNVNNQRMLPEDYFLLTGIRVLGSTLTAATTDALKTAQWGELTPAVLNGRWKFALESTTFYDNTAVSAFNQNRTDKEIGMFELGIPKMLYPNRLIDFSMDFADTIGESTNYGVRVELCGVRTRKA